MWSKVCRHCKRGREIVRGAEHAVLGGSAAVGVGVLELFEKLKQEDLTSFLTAILPSNWSVPGVIAGMGVSIVILHFLVGNQAKKDQ